MLQNGKFLRNYIRIFLMKLESSVIKISLGWIVRCWQCKDNYIDTHLHTSVLTFTQPHKVEMSFYLKKIKLIRYSNKIRVGGMNEVPKERMETAHQECC